MRGINSSWALATHLDAMFTRRSRQGVQGGMLMAVYSFASALDAVVTRRKDHTREAKRLCSAEGARP